MTGKAALEVHVTTPHLKELVRSSTLFWRKPFTQLFMSVLIGA
jgi:quinol monooxygenase YgiN